MVDDGEELGLAAAITVAWLSNPHTRAHADDVSAVLGSLFEAVRGLGTSSISDPEPVAAPEHTPAVTQRKSLASPDHIVSMIDGKAYRSLTRHLRSHGLTPDDYRRRFNLKPDYPMIAPSYSAQRSAAAKRHQFGRKAITASTPEQATQPKRGRKSVAEARQAAQDHLGTSESDVASS